MAHMHITSWVLALILVLLVTMFYKQGNAKVGKILHMILRLDYLFILFTGGSLLGEYFSSTIGHTGELVIKVIAGIWAIAAMEMVSIKTSKKDETQSWWIQLDIASIFDIVLRFYSYSICILP